MDRPRSILHVDLDAFFVSCELLRRPELRGLPVAVAGDRESHPGSLRAPGRAVISAASYEARPAGVRSAIPLAKALQLCPKLVVLPVDIAHYAAISREVFSVFHEFTPLVEPGSLDEAYLDVTGSQLLHGGGEAVARSIQAHLSSSLGLPASVGVAGTKTVAKIASDLRKPLGLVVVPPGTEAEFLAPLPIERMPGVGPKTTAKLRLVGIATLGQLAAASPQLLGEVLGPSVRSLQDRARGEDPSPVVPPGVPKSISREETYGEDLAEIGAIEERLRMLAAAVGQRLRAAGLVAATIAVKLRFSNFETLSRRSGVPSPVCADLDLFKAALPLLRREWRPDSRIRLLGLAAEGLTKQEAQMGLFDADDRREERVDRALDTLRRRYGPQAIKRGTDTLGAPRDWNRGHLDDLRGE